MADKDELRFSHSGSFRASKRTVTQAEIDVEGAKLQGELCDLFEDVPGPVIMEALTQCLSLMVVQTGEFSGEAVTSRSRLVVNILCNRINRHFKVIGAKRVADHEIAKAVAKSHAPHRQPRKGKGK